jgi:hypothetical protein
MGIKSRTLAEFQKKSVVAYPARLRMISTGCEMAYNDKNFYIAGKSIIEQIENPYLPLEEAHGRLKLDW